MEKLKVASLFCGCGGTDVGLLGDFDFLGKHYESNGMEIVYANDIDDNACSIFKENFGIKNGIKIKLDWQIGVALVNVPNRASDYGTFYQSIYSIQVYILFWIHSLVHKIND